MTSLIIYGILVLFLVVFAIIGFTIVQQAEAMIVERMGAYHRTLNQGINFIWPILEEAREIEWKYIKADLEGNKVIETKNITRIDLRETVYDFPEQSVITKDNVVMKINAILYFRVTTPKDAYYQIKNLPDALEKLTQTSLRSTIGEMTLDQTLSSRDEINTGLQATLDHATDPWGVKVTRVELQNVTPPEDIKNAMEAEMRAERTKRASILTAEGKKAAAILEAEGIRAAAIFKAEGEAKSLELTSQAESGAITIITAAIKDQGGDPTQYLVAMRYIEAFKEMVSGKDNKVIYLPFEATGVLGSIGGIKEMFNNSTDRKRILVKQPKEA